MANLPIVSSLVYIIAKNWIAGKSIAEAVFQSKLANSKGFSVIVNYLGEEVKKIDQVQRTIAEYKHLLEAMQKEQIDGSISVKLTQLGLNIDKKYCEENLEEIAKCAYKAKRFLWVDMEGSEFTDDTIDLYAKLLSKNQNVGLCIQAYLRRSKGDIERLVAMGGKIRLVKGAYNESANIAYKSKADIGGNFAELMEYLFKNSANLFSVATHDERLVRKTVELNQKYQRIFEFGFLKGIREQLKLELAKKGFRVTEYIPYGENWLPYSYRRMREKPSNMLLLARSLISR
jgi:proline dehydrogenase